MPLSRAQKQRMRKATPNAAAPQGQTRDGNGVDRKDGRARPDAPQGSPVEPLDTKARIIKTRS